ncbi:MAG: hypothetical protein E4G94_02125 [ANME-2 cluster archaeon]|nr:MAG: hypothetical protein E4G94_02125 [ANME-2 cluster archaeon]
MRNKRMKLGALIMGLLIVNISFASAISAQAVQVETNMGTSAGTVYGTFVDQDTIGSDCGCCGEGGIGNANVTVRELLAKEKNQAVAKVLSNAEVKKLKAMLIEKGYKPKIHETRVNMISLKNESDFSKGLVVEMPFEKDPNSDIGRIIVVTNGDIIKVGAGTIKKVGNSTNIEVFEYKNGEISTQKIVNDNGIISIDGNVVTASSDDCSTCLTVCEYIYAGGCTLGGYFLCVAACAPIGNIACIPICGVIYALICVYLSNEQCPVLCDSYCP